MVSDLETHTGFWLRFVSNHVSARFAKQVEQCGVSVSEWVALRQMYPSSRMTSAQLVQSLGMTKGAISKVLDRLSAKGLARRVANPDDSRAQFIELTSSGRKLVPRLAKLADENDRHFFGGLNSKDHAVLVRTFKGIVRQHGLKKVPTE